MFTPFRGLDITFILTCSGRFYPRRCSDTRSPRITYVLYTLLVLAPFREGEERQVPESGSDQTLIRKNTKDAEGTWHPFSPRCRWYCLRVRNLSRQQKLESRPPRCRPRPDTCLAAAPQPGPARGSLRPARACRVCSEFPGTLAYVWERTVWGRPAQPLDGRAVQEGHHCPLPSVTCPSLAPSPSPDFCGWGRGEAGARGDTTCGCRTVPVIPNLMLCGVKLCFVSRKNIWGLLTGGTLVTYSFFKKIVIY